MTFNYRDDKHLSRNDEEPPSLARSHDHSSRQRTSFLQNQNSDDAASTCTSSSLALPSKVYVKFYVHEEATSSQTIMCNDLSLITSEVTVSGQVFAQVQSINVLKNKSPITIDVKNTQHPEKLDWRLSSNVESDGVNTIYIPKTTIEQVEVATYTNSFSKQLMPVTVKSEMDRKGDKCRAAFGFVSNPSNSGPLRDIVVTLAIHPSIIFDSIVIRGDGGSYNELRNLVTWKIKELPRREIFALGISGKLIPSYAIDSSKFPTFPLVLRCSSRTDGVSGVEVETKSNEFAKATSKTFYSFRLVHRAS